MTPEQAADLAARTLAAIDADAQGHYFACAQCTADRARVESDLAGLRRHLCDHLCSGGDYCWPGDGPCPDAARYADGLIRTAALYGLVR